jgi:hypothetical protein
MDPAGLPPMTTPSIGSTIAFLAVVFAVCGAFVYGVWSSGRGLDAAERRRAVLAAGGSLALVLGVSAAMAELGLVRALAGTYAFVAFPLFWNALALGTALSPLGRRMAAHLSLPMLVGFQAFRWPLELVLHGWYREGVLPVQMTFEGSNFDILTGVLAVGTAAGLRYGWLPPWSAWIFNLVGLALLGAVVRIAVLSSPVPLRTYLHEPTVLLAFHAPFVWIISICVAGALFGHVLTFRALLDREH